MNVFIIGGGGRESALALKISQSSLVDKIYAAPGNPGIRQFATCVDIPVNNISDLVTFAKEKGIGLTIVGPEGPLDNGIVDAFRAEGLVIFGPTAEQAQLEMSKVFCKKLLWEHGIPTADGDICLSVAEADAAIDSRSLPVVVKPDGGTEGKGVKVCQTREEAKAHVRKIMVKHAYAKTGDTGKQVIIEECLIGREASITVLTDGNKFVELATSEDHKQAFDNDKGPMSGGMGAYSPSAIADKHAETIRKDIIEPLVKALPGFRGVVYIALMITADGPKVLEVNVRFGDPEAQVVLPRMKTDLVEILLQIAQGDLQITKIEWDPCFCVCVVSVSGCYPESGYPKGNVITGIKDAEALDNVIVFQAGTQEGTGENEGELVTSGGRVLGVSALAPDMSSAIELAYTGTGKIKFASQRVRKDIGQRPAA
jgi:phosphoribosylamine--glycine ligase